MNTATVQRDTIRKFKSDVDSLLLKRNYLMEHILPTLTEGKDYYVVNGKRSLGKAGAERLAAVHQMTARFTKDTDTLESFKNISGLVAYRCILARNGKIVGEGRGSAMISACQNDPNKTIKMAQKSSYIDSVIRATGLSDTFTQDLEDMAVIQNTTSHTESAVTDREIVPEVRDPMTERQHKYIIQLINEKSLNDDDREKMFADLNGNLNRVDASDMIDSLLAS